MCGYRAYIRRSSVLNLFPTTDCLFIERFSLSAALVDDWLFVSFTFERENCLLSFTKEIKWTTKIPFLK